KFVETLLQKLGLLKEERFLYYEDLRKKNTKWANGSTDPEVAVARTGAMALTPNPAEVISEKSIVRLFSPRKTAKLLGWYGRRMLNSANSVWFTAAFGVTAELVDPIARRRDQMRFVLMEKSATVAVKTKLTEDLTHIVLSYGTPLGELYTMKNGPPRGKQFRSSDSTSGSSKRNSTVRRMMASYSLST